MNDEYLVEHRSQNLGRHDQAARFGVDLNVSGQDSDLFRFKRLLEISELLVRQRLDRRRVDRAREMLLCERDRVFGNDRFTRRRVRRDKDRVADLHVVDRFFLERVELERILKRATGQQSVGEFPDLRKKLLTSRAMSGTSSRKLTISRFTSTT